MTLREMQELRERLVAEARARLDEINNSTDEARTAELESQHDGAMAELDALDRQIERELQFVDLERRAADIEDRAARGDDRRPSGPGEGQGSDQGQAPSYRQAFHAWLGSNVPNADPLSAEARAVLRAGYQEIQSEQRAQVVGTDAAGGYTVPTELANILVRSMLAWGPMYDPGATQEIVTSGGGQIDMPTVNDTAVTAGAHNEGQTLTDDGGKDVTFGQKSLNAFAFDTEWVRVSRELAEDSIFAMETLLGDLLGERLGRIANSQLTVGTGSDAPNGIVTASTLGVSAVSPTALTFDELIDLEHSVDPAYRSGPRVRYMMNDQTLKAIRKLKDGDGNYLWQAGNVQAGIPGTINGRPYSINQAMAGIAAGNRSVVFGDFGKYYVRKVGQPIIGAIQDKDFWPGFGVAGYIRFDGELADTAAVKHLAQA